MISTIDTIRALFTYLICAIVVLGGGIFLFISRGETASQPTALVIAGFIGAVLQFVTGQETQTRTARQTNTASQAGAVMHANGIAGTPPS